MKTEINPPVQSKINWTAIVGGLAAVATVFGLDISPESQAQIAAGIVVVQNALIVIMRTFFTKPD